MACLYSCSRQQPAALQSHRSCGRWIPGRHRGRHHVAIWWPSQIPYRAHQRRLATGRLLDRVHAVGAGRPPGRNPLRRWTSVEPRRIPSPCPLRPSAGRRCWYCASIRARINRRDSRKSGRIRHRYSRRRTRRFGRDGRRPVGSGHPVPGQWRRNVFCGLPSVL